MRIEATHDILEKALLEVRKFALGHQETNWTPAQFWEIIRLFQMHPRAVVYGEALHGPVLKGDQTPLLAMEQAELIAMTNKGGTFANNFCSFSKKKTVIKLNLFLFPVKRHSGSNQTV